MAKQKKPMKFKNVLESLDQFKIEHNFKYTKKEAKGTIIGFCFSAIYIAILVWYFYNRVHLFWTHDEDQYTTYNTVQDFKKLGAVDLKETQFTNGVFLETSKDTY